MAGTEIAKRDSNEISLDFGVGKGLSLEGLTPEQQNEIAYKLQSKKREVAVDVAERKARLESSVADSANVVGSAKALGSKKTYTVNVKSAGPDREFNTYDDIWSYPDEIN